ncbi:MAG: TetR/AcrR family transcriptional regulator [Actinomycetota bacterium]
MAGHREQKKQRTFREVVAVAARLFRDAGYDGTTIEAIAAESGVSPGTVYNYFGTKSAILMAVVTADTEHALAEASRSVDFSADGPVDALMPVVVTYLQVTTALGRNALRELFALGFDSPQSPMLSELVTLDERILEQLAQIIGGLRDRGLVKDDVDPIAAAILVYSVVAVAIMMYVAYPDQTVEDIAGAVRGQLSLAFDGMAVQSG